MSRLSSSDAPTQEADAPESEADEAAAPDTVREAMLDQLGTELGDALVDSHIEPDIDLTVRVTADAWADTAAFLKTGMGFAFFNFLSVIDWLPSPFGRDMDSQVDLALGLDEKSEIDATLEHGTTGGDTRFQVFARVNDVVNHRALTIKADVPDDSLTVPTWVKVYAGANWHEREAWEMFGISFEGHPGLRKLYLPGDFEGNPLRKDYPLLARRVKPWPGIVDVEAMPGEDEDAGDDAGEVSE